MDFKSLIIYEDQYLLIIDKPAGLATESRKVTEKDAVTLATSYCKSQVHPIHRLDQPVSGLLLFAKDQKTAAILSSAISSDRIGKFYTVKVHRELPMKGRLEDYLLKDKPNLTKVVEKNTAGAKKAVLEYERTSYDAESDCSIATIKLFSGRHHQIRVQLANAGFPIVGDKKYGKADSSAALCLSSTKLVFKHPVTGSLLSAEAKPRWLS